MDSGNQEKPKKTKGLRSNAVSTSAITAPVTVGNTISDYAPTAAYTFSPLEMEIAEALLLLAHGDVVSESKSKPKMHKCTVCGAKYPSGQALGGHKRLHYKGIIKKRVAEVDPVESRAEKKPKSDA